MIAAGFKPQLERTAGDLETELGLLVAQQTGARIVLPPVGPVTRHQLHVVAVLQDNQALGPTNQPSF